MSFIFFPADLVIIGVALGLIYKYMPVESKSKIKLNAMAVFFMGTAENRLMVQKIHPEQQDSNNNQSPE